MKQWMDILEIILLKFYWTPCYTFAEYIQFQMVESS